MKPIRYISLIIALLSVLGLAAQRQQSQYALYNYRNDGDFNAWLNIDVDSITYSNIGLDSVEYDNIVTQEVWTPDSCYRIPIEAIDSIGFRAPETQYKEGVFFLNEEHEPYVRIIDDMKIIFDSATPALLLPSVGQVICTETSYGIFEDGFAGRASSVKNTDDGIEFTCEEVSLSDIFDQFIYVSKCSSTEGGDLQEYRAKSSRKRIFDYAIGIDEVIPIELDPVETPKEIDGEKMPVQFKYTPEMEITCLISVLKNHPAVAKVTFHHSHALSLGMDYEKKWNPEPKEWWFSKKDIRIHIPVAAVDAVIKPYVNFGAFIDYNAKVKFEYELPLLKFEQTFGVDYSEYRKEEDRLQFFNETEFVHDDPTLSLSLDGSLAFGLAMKIGAKLIHKRLLNFEATFHVGPEFKGHIDLSTDRIGEDANLYRQLKTTTLDLYGYVAIPQATYQYVGSGVKLAKRGTWKGAKWSNHVVKTGDLLPNEWFPEGIMIDWPIRKWHLLPEFEKPEVYEANATAAVASVEPFRNLLFPVDVGIAFKNYQTGEVVEKDCGSYWGTKHNAESTYTTTFEDLTPSSVYKVYPTVSLLGIKMDAEPSVDYGVAGKLLVTPTSITIKKGEEAEVIIFGAEGNLSTIDDDPSIAKSLNIIYDHRAGQHITLHILGVSVGSTYITVLNRSNGSSCIVRVNVVDTDKPVTGITLSETTLNMKPNDTKALTATVLPEDADNKTVVWESSVEGVALVSDDGLVTAVAKGSCVITCSATDGSGVKAECQVTVSSGTIPEPIGVWTFDNKTNLMEGIRIATLQGATHSRGKVTTVDDLSDAGITFVSGPTEGNGAITIPAGSSLLMNTNLNTSSLSTYSLLMDIHVTELNGYTALLQNDLTNVSDACLFINNGKLGLGEIGYHGTLSSDCWNRVLFVVKDNMAKVFINRELVGQGSSANANKWLMSTGALFFGDDDREEHTVDVSEIRFWDEALTESQVKQFGSLEGVSFNPAGESSSNTGIGKYVDLGLPSGTLWATCNVGANSPEEYGDYFAWGETEPKNEYEWSTYKYCNGSFNTLTKYCTQSDFGTVDNKTELEPADEAATIKWGPDWQIPNKEQMDELTNSSYTTARWTTQNGINGLLITSKNNGNSIFLPAAGFYRATELVSIGNRGYYWTRSLRPENSCDAYDIRFKVGTIDKSDDLSRYFGQSIRAVRKHNSDGGGGGGSW